MDDDEQMDESRRIMKSRIAALQQLADQDMSDETWELIDGPSRYLTPEEMVEMERQTAELDAEIKEALKNCPRRYIPRSERGD